jgi:hypothetical protein
VQIADVCCDRLKCLSAQLDLGGDFPALAGPVQQTNRLVIGGIIDKLEEAIAGQNFSCGLYELGTTLDCGVSMIAEQVPTSGRDARTCGTCASGTEYAAHLLLTQLSGGITLLRGLEVWNSFLVILPISVRVAEVYKNNKPLTTGILKDNR